MRTYSAIFLALFSTSALAAPDPFGLEMTKSCSQTQKYDDSLTLQGVNKFSGGNQYKIDSSAIDFRGLKSVTAICNDDLQLVAVIGRFQKQFGGQTFDRLVNMLSKNYRKVEVNSAHVGNQTATFRSGNVEINVSEPHMSHTTKMTYMTDSFKEKFNKKRRREKRQQRNQEAGSL